MRHNPRFPTRRDGLYYLEGDQYDSVTEVLTALAKPALIPWAVRMGAKAIFADPEKVDTAEKAVAAVNQIKFDAASRGTNIHALVAEWAKTGTLPVPENDDPFVRGFLSFARAWQPRPLFSECTVFSRVHKYAGRLDLISQITQEVWLLDFKTSKAVWPENGLQLTAYRHADCLRQGDDPTVHPMPHVDHTGIVLIPGDGGFDFKEVNEPLEVFLALKTVHAWTKHRAA